MDLLEQWARYLLENGLDPDNQLCTDDFAGHLARNANLSMKAIMGVASFGLLKGMEGNAAEAAHYRKAAEKMAADWKVLANSGEQYSKLAFGQEGSYGRQRYRPIKMNLPNWCSLCGKCCTRR